MKPDEVAVPRELVEALREACVRYDGHRASGVLAAARALVYMVSVNEGQSDTERPAEGHPTLDEHDWTCTCDECNADLVRRQMLHPEAFADPYAGVRKEAPDEDARIAELEATLAREMERANCYREMLHAAMDPLTWAEFHAERCGAVEGAQQMKAERDVLADKVRALADEWDERDPNPPHPRSERLRALLSDPAPPAAQMPDSANEAYLEWRPTWKYPNPQPSIEDAFLAGFDAGAER